MSDDRLACILRERGGVVVRGDLVGAGVRPAVIRRALVDGRRSGWLEVAMSCLRCPSSSRRRMGIRPSSAS
ncbi:hypothetical protein [Leekyejoonella antrihumi]|uniref:Uncharacterized protein n=1 Tax=Leekyejoonella antrihumi TaxID=1660198 RepID=A0A563E7W2_9MICO|nr:hypothetical protein [Leekyejoonella antrihumi]TWP38291.1 hypothetical protein FGL98_03520 [Leekyejoonella antrihumi]